MLYHVSIHKGDGKMSKRDDVISVTISPEILAVLDALAMRKDMTRSAMIRHLVMMEYIERAPGLKVKAEPAPVESETAQ
jgi:metal-responsive CopG/Arc/MetJ family transcriptional regulator